MNKGARGALVGAAVWLAAAVNVVGAAEPVAVPWAPRAAAEARVATLLPECGLRSTDWGLEVMHALTTTWFRAAQREAYGQKWGAPEGVAFADGILTGAMDAANEEHRTYGDRACAHALLSPLVPLLDAVARPKGRAAK